MFIESAIGQHFLDNLMYAKNYSDKKYYSLFVCLSFHLSALEAVYIKSCKPNLSHQKKHWLHVLTPFSNTQSSSFSFIRQSIEFFSLHSNVYLLTSVGQKALRWFFAGYVWLFLKLQKRKSYPKTSPIKCL